MSDTMFETAQEEKRALRRKAFFRTVRVELPSGAKIAAPTFDITFDGIGLILDIDIKRGNRAKLSFPLPLSPDNIIDIELTGVCTHSHLSGKVGGFKTGMQFHNAPAEMIEAIKMFMEI